MQIAWRWPDPNRSHGRVRTASLDSCYRVRSLQILTSYRALTSMIGAPGAGTAR